MKRFDLMSKEEIINATMPYSCADCIVPETLCKDPTIACTRRRGEYLLEDVKVEKKRRCDIYSKEELSDQYSAHCNRYRCEGCEYSSAKNNNINCVYNFAYTEVDTINGKEVVYENT